MPYIDSVYLLLPQLLSRSINALGCLHPTPKPRASPPTRGNRIALAGEENTADGSVRDGM